MRTSGPLPSPPGLRLTLQRAGSVVRESLLLAGGITLLEAAGPLAPHDGADLVVIVGAVLLGLLLAQAARWGWMPASLIVAQATWRKLKALGRRLAPRYAVAFRPTPDAGALADRTLAAPRLWLLALLVACAAGGPWLLDGLALLKEHVSYALYLVLLGALWGVLLVTVVFGCLAAAQWLHGTARAGRGSVLPFLLFAAGWIAGLVASSFLPGWVVLASLLCFGWWSSRTLADLPEQRYLFCRRDARGRARVIPVRAYLRQVHTVIVLALAVVVVLGHSRRLWFAEWPQSPFVFTSWMGLLAGLCALLLVGRAGAHFRRMLGGGRVPPEVPLTPTLWIRRAPIRAEGGEEERRDAYWYRVAREAGWLVLRDAQRPAHAYDLVLGDESDPRRFVPREPVDEADARFQLARRFHVVRRRRFHTSFQRLFKRLRGEDPQGGTGYLFCPHVWLVPGVVRDVETRERRGSPGSLASPTFYGPPYAEAFSSRSRRYIGQVLRDLQVDILFWEDAVTWKDLRHVLTVAYEIHDQRRAPLLERHFVGVPRVRVVIQEEAAEAEGPGALPSPESHAAPAPGHARILLVLRDRGGREDARAPDPADHGIRTPSLV